MVTPTGTTDLPASTSALTTNGVTIPTNTDHSTTINTLTNTEFTTSPPTTSKHTAQTVTSTFSSTITTNFVTPTFTPTSTVNPNSNTTATIHTPSTVSSNITPLTQPTAAPTSESTSKEISSSSPQTSSLTTPTSKVLTSAEIISTNTLTTVSHSTSTITLLSNATVTLTTSSTTPQCRDKDCPGCTGTCIFNTTLGGCNCLCQDFVFGNVCTLGQNDTSAHIDTEEIPTRKANFTLALNVTFQDAYNNLSSPQSVEFIKTLERELEVLCNEADPQSFKKVQVIKLSPGSVVAESAAEYVYANNETQIQFVNTQLDGVLTGILNDKSNLNKISQAFHNASVQLNGLTFQPPEIKNITDLKPFVNCTQFANYTAEISNGQWQCVGPCKTNPDYCHQHGECDNNIYKGPVCRCFESSLEQFYGPQCDLFRRGPGFYGALFGSLAAALMLLIVIVIAVTVKKKHMGVWKRNSSFTRRLSAFEEDFFDFSDAGHHNFGIAGNYKSEGFSPSLQNVDTQLSQQNIQMF